MKRQNTIAMIPARIGSNRLKFKNLALINHKPMIYYAIKAAKDSKCFDKIIVNSDHRIFEEIAKRYKIDFYIRKKKLGGSNIKSDDIVYDFLKAVDCKTLCWINPIAPLQTGGDIKKTIQYYKKNNLDSLITTESKKVHSLYLSRPVNYKTNRKFDLTQELNPVQIFNYTIMMWDKNIYLKNYQKNKYAFFCGKFGTMDLNRTSSIIVKNIDDLNMVRYIMKNQKNKNKITLKYDKILKKIPRKI